MTKIYTENFNDDKQKGSFFQEKFEHSQGNLNFQDTPKIRDKVTAFLNTYSIPQKTIDNVNLSITEVLSNLVKHPKKPLSFLKVSISNSKDLIKISITDNSTSFKDFNNVVTKAQNSLNKAINMQESGFGLGLISHVNQSLEYISSNKSNDKLNHFITLQTITIYKDGAKTQPSPELNDKPLIFIIDDEISDRKIYTKILEDKYNIISFEHAKDAIKAFVEQKPELIISDLIMPNMNGIDLRKKLSELEDGDTTPFIFISAESDKEDSIYINDLGIDDFLCKPVKPARLHHIVSRLLKRSAQIQDSLQKQLDDEITQFLEPSIPDTYEGYKFKLAYAVAEAGGGDFITYKEDEDRLTVLIADVMGHGKKAKFFSYMYAGYLNSILNVNVQNNNAAEILQQLSLYINKDRLLEDVILTCQCAQLFPDGKIDIASAGHPYPILIRQKTNSAAEIVYIKGALPGLTDQNIYNLLSLQLKPGDKLIFMTDGILETFSKGSDAIQHIINIIDENIHLQIPELLDILWETYKSKTQDPLSIKDDATLLIMEYNV